MSEQLRTLQSGDVMDVKFWIWVIINTKHINYLWIILVTDITLVRNYFFKQSVIDSL